METEMTKVPPKISTISRTRFLLKSLLKMATKNGENVRASAPFDFKRILAGIIGVHKFIPFFLTLRVGKLFFFLSAKATPLHN